MYITVKHVKNGINQDLKNCQVISKAEDFDPIVKLKGQQGEFKIVYFTHSCQCMVLVHCLQLQSKANLASAREVVLFLIIFMNSDKQQLYV